MKPIAIAVASVLLAGPALAASQLLIFGNPALGTPAMQADPLAGLYLPLKVLAYEDADGALGRLTAAAAGG